MYRHLLQDLNDWKARPARKPILLDGARQTGKTYLLRELFGREFPQVLCVDFIENPGLADVFSGSLDPAYLIEQLELATGQSFKIGQDLLILDEIAYCPRALTSLKYFAEKMPQAHVAAVGSTSGLLQSFSVCKVEPFVLRPLSFREFLQAGGDERLMRAFTKRSRSALAHKRLFEELTDYFFTGGLPEAVAEWFSPQHKNLLSRVEAVNRLHATLITAHRGDLAMSRDSEEGRLMDDIFTHLPQALFDAQEESVVTFSQFNAAQSPNWNDALGSAIQQLHAARIILKNHPLQGVPKRPLAVHKQDHLVKLFLFDIGLLHHMLGVGYMEIKGRGRDYPAYVAESFVQQELAVHSLEPGFSWRDGVNEVECLIANDFGQVIPVEIKASSRASTKALETYDAQCLPHKTLALTNRPGTGPEETFSVERALYYAESLVEEAQVSSPVERPEHAPPPVVVDPTPAPAQPTAPQTRPRKLSKRKRGYRLREYITAYFR